MSGKQWVEKIIEGYGTIQEGIYPCWRQQQQKAILKIRSISGDIKDLERSIKKGTIACRSVGFVAGVMTMAGILGAPFTFGGSLSLTAVGTGIGVFSGAVDILQTWVNSSDISSKCNEAITLLQISRDLTAKLTEQTKKLHEAQTQLCIVLKTSHIILKAVGLACGETLIGLMTRNIPNIEQSSRTLLIMFESSGTTVCVVSIKSTGPVAAPVAGKAVSGMAKKSLRCIGAAAVGIALIVDVVNIVNNAGALDQNKLSDMVTGLEDAANEMENEMKRYDQVFTIPSSVQNTLIKKMW